MPDAIDAPVTLAGIARLAGVGRAAVSNWRRRHDSFPTPVGGTDASPQFSLADVEQWLHAHGKIERIRLRERLWPHYEVLGDRAVMGAVLAEAGRRLLAADGVDQAVPVQSSLPEEAAQVVDQTVDAARHEGGRDTFEFLLSRWLEVYVRQVSTTPNPLGRLMVDIALAVRADGAGGRSTRTVVLDPACGVGGLLLAADEGMREGGAEASSAALALLGTDVDPVLAALAAARLGFARACRGGVGAEIRAGDSLRADPQDAEQADIVVCNPPFNARDWGHEELATDPRWVYGLPPRTEPELAWIEHALASLASGGVAVLLLPPAVASRRAGRRIRSALLRTGVLRGVIALPAGAAQPHSVSLQLWILQASSTIGGAISGDGLFLLDAAISRGASRRAQSIDWPRLSGRVLDAVHAHSWSGEHRTGAEEQLPEGCVIIPVMDLLDEQTDLTPARHVPETAMEAQAKLHESWGRLDGLLDEVRSYSRSLAAIALSAGDDVASTVTVSDLDRARALKLLQGQALPSELLHRDALPDGAVPVVSVPDLILGVWPGSWLAAAEVEEGFMAGSITVAAPGDVIVAGVERAYRVWVQEDTPVVLGPQLYALRLDPEILDPWFLASCLRAPANARQAGSHTSSSARVDVRKLQVLQLSLAEQRVYGAAFKELLALEEAFRSVAAVGEDLVRGLGDGLAGGRLRR